MRCESCGRDLPTTANFCGSCGTSVTGQQQAQRHPASAGAGAATHESPAAASASPSGTVGSQPDPRDDARRKEEAINSLQRWGQADRERARTAPPSYQPTYRVPVVAKVMRERTSTVELIDRLATTFKVLAIAALFVGAVATIVVLVSLSQVGLGSGSVFGAILLGGLYTALAALSLLLVHAALRALAAITVGTAFSDDERSSAAR